MHIERSRKTAVQWAALLACLAATLDLLLSLWNAIRTIPAAQDKWFLLASLSLLAVVGAVLPFFYFALWRDGARLELSTRLRILVIGAAVVLAALEINSIRAVLGTAANLAGLCFDLTNIALLVALGCAAESDAERGSVSKLLITATNAALIVGAMLTALSCIGLLMTPYMPATIREIRGGSKPSAVPWATAMASAALSRACLLAVPSAVWRSIREQTV